ncbi:MAG: CCA tRNA nucleotidyltransferase [Planctomycetaceae bacterium]|jgi:poly(A) polymerase
MTVSPQFQDSQPKRFALDVVQRLRDAGFEAVWAGGCVRDALLGIAPKDYDVATSARPIDVVQLFGEHKTVSVGASFGVIVVLGRRRSDGQVEVATFRTDGEYSDGRRPVSIQFCSAEEDAVRRDFTINGIFYDPITDVVIDYVGGQKDLQRRVVRAIGTPKERFEEDKLRMLRATRFAARFQFSLDESTADAIRERAADLRTVSVERIAQELRQMLAHASRHVATDLLVETKLFSVLLPATTEEARNTARSIMPFLTEPAFEPAMAALLQENIDSNAERAQSRTVRIAAICRDFKLSNQEISTICWLCDGFDRCSSPSSLPLHTLKPLLADHRRTLLLDLINASVRAGRRPEADIEFLRGYLTHTTPEAMNPPPLITGSDLKSLGMGAGPAFSTILRQIRNEQLDEVISTRDEAMSRAEELR